MRKLLAITLVTFGLTSAQSISANEAINQLNHQVEIQANQLDQQHQILLTFEERDKLKLSLIANKISQEFHQLSVTEQRDKAIDIYAISDPSEQRQLLIDLQQIAAKMNGGGEGIDPK